MDFDNHILHILELLSNNKVDFILAGGVAVVLQGVERATMDIDISLEMRRDNVQRFLKVIEKLKMVPRAPVPSTVLLDPDKVRSIVKEKGALVFTFLHPENPFQQIDVFLTSGLSYEKLLGGSEEITIGKTKLRLLSKQQLIDLKKQVVPSRDKDRFDIRALEELLKGK